MRKKNSFIHPRSLAKERTTIPMIPEYGDETFYNGIFRFHITALLKWLEEHPQPVVEVPVRIWYETVQKEDCHVEATELIRPIVIVEIAPDYRDFLPDIREDDWYARGYVCVDGQHRLEKAKRMGLETLPAVILRMEQHIPFLYAGYEQYVDYWNGKLKDRAEDARRELRIK